MAQYKTVDGNEAVARVAYKTSEVIAIYPITPASPMGEWADQWASENQPNLWGAVPQVIEMQSEAGAAGAVHGALQTGSLATTFTASQGLLLMIPNMYKIAGELTPAVFHVAARTVAAHALSIFGDHSDVMACRATGWAMLAAGSVQEAQDMALIAHAATLEARIPFLHFFDGFRTSHEINKLQLVSEGEIQGMLDEAAILRHRERALTPERPVIRGTAQNPDVFFQARETVNPFYAACPGIVESVMARLAERSGRAYRAFDYYGAPDAERVLVAMGSGCETIRETVDELNARSERTGLLQVRLYRPFDGARFAAALPETVRAIAVLDRTKEPGAGGEPLYLDCVTALSEDAGGQQPRLARMPRVVGGRYGLSSKEFTPAMAAAVFANLAAGEPKNHFTVGIVDDVSGTSLDADPAFSTESADVVRAIFYGLGSDGTVGANKNTIKIIGENTPLYAQGYFVYDSKKAGAETVSHLRFGPRPIRSTYLISQANFVGCHQEVFLERKDVTEVLAPGGVFLLNTRWGPGEVWEHLPRPVREGLLAKQARFYVIDAYKVSGEVGLGRRINTIMQAAFFAISRVLPPEEAKRAIEEAIRDSYGKKGEAVVEQNLKAVEQALGHLHEVMLPEAAGEGAPIPPPFRGEPPVFVRDVLGPIYAGNGNALPVSALPTDGTFPAATARFEKRNLALEIPVWDPPVCIQCGKCAMVCPHAVIRIKVCEPAQLEGAPETLLRSPARDREWAGLEYIIQVAPEDCTGCGICVDVCPARNKSQARLKAINMTPQPPIRERERVNWDFFLEIPELERSRINASHIRQQQIQEPLFEFSGACAGCGETPYLKLMTQLFGDRMLVANATGCSSIYGGNLPTTPWSANREGRGPAWANSLFEDNAEFGLGFRVSLDQQREFAAGLLGGLASQVGEELAQAILEADQSNEPGIFEQRERVAELKRRLTGLDAPEARRLAAVADALVRRSVWIVGGDGWAYDIGFGGLDHVLASGRDVNILVMDTEVYSNTGGQASKATPRAAVAKFAAAGKRAPKKDLGLFAMSYGSVYVASVAMGARDEHTLRAFLEAEAYPGPSLIIAYSHCIAHGIDMETAMQGQKLAVNSGHWLLYRYHPERAGRGENPLLLDSRPPSARIHDYFLTQNRFKMLTKTHPEEARRLFKEAQQEVEARFARYQRMAESAMKPQAPAEA